MYYQANQRSTHSNSRTLETKLRNKFWLCCICTLPVTYTKILDSYFFHQVSQKYIIAHLPSLAQSQMKQHRQSGFLDPFSMD